jgi:hypothetical protein
MIPPPRNILVSFHYYAKYNLDKLAACRIVGDSGAFTAKAQGIIIENKQLAAWAKVWNHRLAWVAALDEIGNQAATQRNWLELVDTYQVPGVPTIHCGTPVEAMDFYAERGVDFMGLGGMAGKAHTENAQFRWLVKVFKYARDNHPQMRFHGWGITKPRFMRLPFFSVDSSGWSSSYRYARLALRDPKTFKTVQFQLNGKDVYRTDIVSLLRDHYGVNPSDIATSGPQNRALLVRLSALSASVAELEMRSIHRGAPVSPPSWGRLGGFDFPRGPNQALAVSARGKNYGEEIADLNGPHSHLACNRPDRADDDGREVAALSGPHNHLVMREREGWNGSDVDCINELNGPHQHLVDGFSPHMEIVDGVARGVELPPGYKDAMDELNGPHQHLAIGPGGMKEETAKAFDAMHGPHQHLAMSKGQYEEETLTELNDAELHGPHAHLALNNRQGPADYEGTALADLNGPHQHITDTCAQHLEWASEADKGK